MEKLRAAKKVAPDGGWGWMATFGVSMVNVSIPNKKNLWRTKTPNIYKSFPEWKKNDKNLIKPWSIGMSGQHQNIGRTLECTANVTPTSTCEIWIYLSTIPPTLRATECVFELYPDKQIDSPRWRTRLLLQMCYRSSPTHVCLLA